MATRRKRNLNFLPAETRPEPVIDISAYPVDIGVGELMRLTRERLGHELQTVANQLRIRLSYLEAIEEARFKDLPGTTYAVGFVRSYADYLGLDGADIVRRFREEAARIHGQTKLIFPALTAEGKLPRAAVLLVSAIGLAGVYGVWYYVSSRQQSELPVITEVPDRLAVLAPDGSDGTEPDRPPEGSATPQSAPLESPPTTAGPPAAGQQLPAAPVDPGLGSANAATPPEPPVEVPAPAANGADASTAAPAAPVAPVETAAPTDTTESASTAGTSPAPPAPSAETGPQATGVTAEPSGTSSSDSSQPSATPPAEGTATATTTPPGEPAPPAVPDIAANDIPAAPSVSGQDGSQQAAVPTAGAQPPTQPQPPAEAITGVVLEARMDCWIKVVDAKGKTVIQQTLKAGERYVVPDQAGLVLRTGNAGGLDVIVGGRKAPPLGEVGTVLTKVSLEPSRLLDGTAVTD
jgi:cytoskeleton protein RodZ